MWSWESELLQATRKEMSHYGALPVSYPWEPTHWTDVVTGDAQSASKFYDAGNDVYAFAIHALFPNAESTSRYNSKYLGDVIEGVLGFCWVTRQSTSMGVLLAHASKYVFALKTLLSLESLDKTPDRQRLIEFVSTRSQRNPQQQHVATSSSSTSPAAACSQQQHATPRVRLPKGWFNENERTYLTRLLQHLCPASPPLLSICYEVRKEHGDEATRVTDDAQERVQGPLSSQSADQRTNTAPRMSVVLPIFTMTDFLFEALPWTDQNTSQLRTDFTILTRNDARQRQKEGFAQEATLAEKTRKRARPETPPRGHVAKGEVLHDLPNVVKHFARGWMEEKQYTLLYNASKELQITVRRDLRKHYDSFRKNLLMASDREGEYNRSVSKALEELSGIRRHLARADESLSNEKTEKCLTDWAEEHYFTRAEHRKGADERQKILSDNFVKELGCRYRMRVVLQRGMQDFRGLTKDTDMLNAFLKYVITVEQQAEKLREKLRKPASDSSSEKDLPAPASAAPERAVSQKRPPTAPIPAEGTSGKKETKDPPARKIKKGRKSEMCCCRRHGADYVDVSHPF